MHTVLSDVVKRQNNKKSIQRNENHKLIFVIIPEGYRIHWCQTSSNSFSKRNIQYCTKKASDSL